MLWGAEETFFLAELWVLLWIVLLYKVIQAKYLQRYGGAFQTLSEIDEIGIESV